MSDGLPLLHPQAVHQGADSLAAEDAQEVVLQREVELRGPRVPLAAGAAEELVVDPARLMALAADDVQAAEGGHPLAQADVRPAACHVRGDGDGCELAGALDDLRLALVLLGVQDPVFQAAALEEEGKGLRLLDRVRPDEDRPPLGMEGRDLLGDGLELAPLGAEEHVR